MRTPPSRYRRSVVEFRPQQMGDVSARDAAGRDITHHGADATAVLNFLRSYVFEADQQRETAIKEVRHELARARGDMGIISEAVRSLRERANADDRERARRQCELDHTLVGLGEKLEDQADQLTTLQRGQDTLRRLLVLVAVVLVAVVVVEAALVYRELALLARAGFDAGHPALALWRR